MHMFRCPLLVLVSANALPDGVVFFMWHMDQYVYHSFISYYKINSNTPQTHQLLLYY